MADTIPYQRTTNNLMLLEAGLTDIKTKAVSVTAHQWL
jgi:hypothetical protein